MNLFSEICVNKTSANTQTVSCNKTTTYIMLEEISDIYDCYALLGKVPKEQDKIYYWSQQERLYEIFEPYLKDWKYKKIDIDQYFEVLLKVEKDGVLRVTGKEAPTGGFRNWTVENTYDITTKFLTNNEHLIYSFENYGKSNIDFYPKDKKTGLINIHWAWIKASKNKMSNNFSIYDLYIKFGNWNRVSPKSLNQYFYIYLKRDIFTSNEIELILQQLQTLLFVDKTYYNYRPFRIVWKDEQGMTCFNLVTDDEYGISINGKNGLNSIGNLWKEI
jgi:hypothetical protein